MQTARNDISSVLTWHKNVNCYVPRWCQYVCTALYILISHKIKVYFQPFWYRLLLPRSRLRIRNVAVLLDKCVSKSKGMSTSNRMWKWYILSFHFHFINIWMSLKRFGVFSRVNHAMHDVQFGEWIKLLYYMSIRKPRYATAPIPTCMQTHTHT